jgi:carboxyl-terminal processing protease
MGIVAGGFRIPSVSADEPKPAPAAEGESAEEQPSDAESAKNEKRPDLSGSEEYELQKLFVDTLDQVERNYVNKVSRRELMEAAIHGVLSKLDPYSNYISPDDLRDFKTNVENEFGGIGIQVDMPRPGRLVVVSPLVGSPAYRAGLQSGDRILEIEGKTTRDLKSLDDAISKLKGEVGSEVTISVGPARGGPPRQVKLVREMVQLETVMGDTRKNDDSWEFMVDPEDHIGYIRLTAFSRETQRDLEHALAELKGKGLKGLVLDLRFNPGGLLSSAVAVSDLFVAEGKIVSTEGRNAESRSWEAQKEGTFDGFPMVVLVNRFSASASEIVSACLQDHDRAVVIGERTWGKGSVQNVIELEGGRSALKLTTASYQRPSGKNIHRFDGASDSDDWGVKPNDGFDMRLNDDELAALMRHRRDRDILRVNHHASDVEAKADEEDKSEPRPEETAADDQPADSPKPEDDSPKPESTEDKKPAADDADVGDAASEEKPDGRPFVDRQLERALEYVREQLHKPTG